MCEFPQTHKDTYKTNCPSDLASGVGGWLPRYLTFYYPFCCRGRVPLRPMVKAFRSVFYVDNAIKKKTEPFYGIINDCVLLLYRVCCDDVEKVFWYLKNHTVVCIGFYGFI